jgi:DNA repair protein REV1
MQRSQTNSSDYYGEDDSSFFNALETAVLPGDVELQDELPLEPPPATQFSLKRRIVALIDESPQRSQSSSLEPPPPSQPRQRNVHTTPIQDDIITEESSQELEPPPATQPSLKRQRLEAFEERERLVNNAHDNDIYGASRFGDYGEYMRRKRAKLQIQNAALRDIDDVHGGGIFRGLSIYVSD